MPINIELKARYPDLIQAEKLSKELGAIDAGWLEQIDTYFIVPNGRLKLREINGERAELIQYHRANQTELRRSDYAVIPLSLDQAKSLLAALSAAIGIRVRVVKRRHLLMWRDVRIHLDDVQGLGQFIEFEALVGPNCDERQATEKAATLTRQLDIVDEDRISGSYSDLILAQSKSL